MAWCVRAFRACITSCQVIPEGEDMIIGLLDVMPQQEVVAFACSKPVKGLAGCVMQHEPLAVCLQLALEPKNAISIRIDWLSSTSWQARMLHDTLVTLLPQQLALTTMLVKAASQRLMSRT
jgi:hypothetical protein